MTSLLPAAVARTLVDVVADSASAIVTNNRGPAKQLRFDGRPLDFYVSWAPQRASIGLCLTLFTYAGTMRCSVSADEACMRDPDELVSLFVEEFWALAELAGGEAAPTNSVSERNPS